MRTSQRKQKGGETGKEKELASISYSPAGHRNEEQKKRKKQRNAKHGHTKKGFSHFPRAESGGGGERGEVGYASSKSRSACGHKFKVERLGCGTGIKGKKETHQKFLQR